MGWSVMSIITTNPPFAGTQIGDKTIMANQMSGLTKEAKITTAIARAVALGAFYVYIPANMLPYDASRVTFNASVKMLREGGNNANRDVRAYGAAGDNVQDDLAAIQAAINYVGNGEELEFGLGTFRVSSTIILTKQLKLSGTATGEGGGTSIPYGTKIVGTGITIIRMLEPCFFENITVQDLVGNAATIGVEINDGANGVSKWGFKDCYLLAPHTAKLGTGLKCLFALEGRFSGGCIEGWAVGVDEDAVGPQKSNANSYSDVKIRVNAVGFKTTNIDNAYLNSCIIEGNGTGVKHESGMLVMNGGHLENNTGLLRQIHVTGGNLLTIGVLAGAGGATYKDVYVELGAGRHTSMFDAFNNGIRHDGTGLYTVFSPVNVLPVSGTGPISRIDGGGIQGVQGLTGQVLTLAGYAYLSTALAYLNTAGPAIIGGLNGVLFTDQNTVTKGSVDQNGKAVFANEVLTAAAPTVAAAQVGLGSTVASTVGAAGGASALPATPLGYIIANVAGTQVKIPYYNN